jgi:DNA-binding NarL/FixJ family response regulator
MNRTTAYANHADGTATVAVGAIVDDPELYARVSRALGGAGIGVAASALTPDALAERSTHVDAAVLYFSGETAAVLESVRNSRELLPDTILIVVWPTADALNARRALKAGADALVNESNLEATLVATLGAALSGLVCIPRQMRAPLESESLSMREKQVLGMLVRGFSNAEIAARLYLAESTVKSHLSSAYNKLGVRTRKDAATMILDPAEGLGPGILAISAA